MLALGLSLPWEIALSFGLPGFLLGYRWPASRWLLVIPLGALLGLQSARHRQMLEQRWLGRQGVFLYRVQGKGLGQLKAYVAGTETLRLRVPVALPAFGGYAYGEGLWIRGQIEPLDSVSPVLQRYFQGEGRYLVLRPRVLLGREPARGVAAHLRRSLEQRLQQNLSPPAASLAQALVLGDRRNLARSVLRDFRRTGTFHLLALSGLHVGLLLLILLVFLQTLRVPLRASLLLSTLLLWGYLWVVGPRPSLARGLFFVSAFALAYLVERPRNYLNFLGVAGVFSLLFRPEWLGSVGFQLSYGATLGILVGMPGLPRLRWPWLQRLWEAGWVSVFAQGALIPLLLLHFHGLSVVAPVLNVPLVFLTWLLMAEVFLGLLAGPLGAPFFALADLAARGILAIVHTVARWPWTYLEVSDLPPVALVLITLGVLGGFWLWRCGAPFQGMATDFPEPRRR